MANVIEVRDLVIEFADRPDALGRIAQKLGMKVRDEVVRAVNGVSLSIRKGETLALVGESGCGKSTLGRAVAGLLKPTSGSVHYCGINVQDLSVRKHRQKALATQMIFQDPYSSLNPRMKIGQIIAEAPRVHGFIKGDEVAFVENIMQRVGLDPGYRNRYPHQFSGGQRQRVGIAAALALNPEVVICDEPIAALDVSIQAQVINLLTDLQKDLGLTYLFVSHDLGVVRHIANRVAVMYLGRIVEIGETEQIFADPQHPYTKALVAEIPKLEPVKRSFVSIKGEIPSPLSPPSGCTFHPRCAVALPECATIVPAHVTMPDQRVVACLRHPEVLPA